MYTYKGNLVLERDVVRKALQNHSFPSSVCLEHISLLKSENLSKDHVSFPHYVHKKQKTKTKEKSQCVLKSPSQMGKCKAYQWVMKQVYTFKEMYL
jgi:hypothetical protein